MSYSLLTVPETKLTRVTAYLDADLKEKLEKLAIAETRSLSQLIVVLCKEAVTKAESEGKI